MLKKILLLMIAVLAGCVGTDYIADPVMLQPARILVTPATQALEVGKSAKFQAAYFDSLGNSVSGLPFAWSSSDPAIVVIDVEGNANALKAGQARLTARARNIASDPALVTVVADPNQVAAVIVSPESGTLALGATLQFTASARNLSGAILSGKTFAWRTTNPAIASVSNTGLVTALAAGETHIIASAEGVESIGARVNVASTSRSGAFTKRPGGSYNVSGTATLEQQADGSLRLKFGADFSSSNGPGLDVYLSTTNTVGANSISLGRLQRTTGEQSYNVPSNAMLTTYDWVIIHCVPFNVTFGYAQLR